MNRSLFAFSLVARRIAHCHTTERLLALLRGMHWLRRSLLAISVRSAHFPFRSYSVRPRMSSTAAAASHTDTAQEAVPWPGPRTYESAIEALNSLQSNAAYVEAKRKAGPQFVDGLPLEIENLHRIGHKVSTVSCRHDKRREHMC